MPPQKKPTTKSAPTRGATRGAPGQSPGQPLQAVPPQAPPPQAPPPQPQTPLSDKDRITALESRVDKLSQALAGILAQQVGPAIQEQLQAKIIQELGG